MLKIDINLFIILIFFLDAKLVSLPFFIVTKKSGKIQKIGTNLQFYVNFAVIMVKELVTKENPVATIYINYKPA